MKSIKISGDTYQQLESLRIGRDTFDSIVRRLLLIYSSAVELTRIAHEGDEKKKET